MFRTRMVLVFVVGICALTSASAVRAQLLNPSFEEPDLASGSFDFYGPGQTIGNGWIVGDGGYIDVITDDHNQSASWPDPTHGDQFAYIGDSLAAANVFQDIILPAGTTYQLTFDLASFLNSVGNGARLDLDILFNGNSIIGGPTVFTLPVPHDFAAQSQDFSTGSAGTYRLVLTQPGGYGTMVDNFRLIANVPEPCASILICVVLIAGVAYRPRLRAASSH